MLNNLPLASSARSPHFMYESALSGIVCGIDEAGRGALAGDVYAAAVILNPLSIPDGLNDSKLLSSSVRERLYGAIMTQAKVGVGIATVAEIDQYNILGASMIAMQRAYYQLPCIPNYALIDGNRAPDLECITHTLVKGDTISLSIAAASIVAKVERDHAMHKLAEAYPLYGFSRHAGYGTKMHREALALYGATPYHRSSFKPVKKVMAS